MLSTHYLIGISIANELGKVVILILQIRKETRARKSNSCSDPPPKPLGFGAIGSRLCTDSL